MKKIILFISLTLIITNACSSSQNVKDTKKPQGDYRFNYDPYEGHENKELYNYVFNLVRNRLMYFVDQSLSSYPELIGVVMELKPRGHQKIFKNIMESPAVKGWRIYDDDIVPLNASELKKMNKGSSINDLARYPKARYYIRVSGNNAAVYVSYWILSQRTYNSIYNITKENGRWTIKDSKDI